MEHTRGILKQTIVHSSCCGRSGKRSGQWQLTQLHSYTAVQIIHSVKTFLPWYSSMESWTQSTRFVLLWRGWLVCCCWNDPGFPVVTVTEGEAGRWKRCRYQASPQLVSNLNVSWKKSETSTTFSKCSNKKETECSSMVLNDCHINT